MEPVKSACTLVQKFRQVEHLARRMHPEVARSVALAACRASDPIATAHAYLANYDRIVTVIGRIDLKHARKVASQAFGSDNPLAWARRFHREIVATK
jgi:hypothetical protein